MNIAIALSRGGMNQTKFWLHSRFYNGQALKPLSFKVTMIYFRLNEIKVHILQGILHGSIKMRVLEFISDDKIND